MPRYETPLSTFTAFGQEKAPKSYGSRISWPGHPKDIDVLPLPHDVGPSFVDKTPRVSGDLMLAARDRYLARPDLTDEAKWVIENTPILANPMSAGMAGYLRGIIYGPYSGDPRYQDPDQLAGVFGHEVMHVLDNYYGQKTSNPITEYARELMRESGSPPDYLKWLREMTGPRQRLSDATFQAALAAAVEMGYDPTDVPPDDPYGHHYTYFGEQAPYMIPPPLQQFYPMFNEEAFQMPEGFSWLEPTPHFSPYNATGMRQKIGGVPDDEMFDEEVFRRTVQSIDPSGALGFTPFDYIENPYDYETLDY